MDRLLRALLCCVLVPAFGYALAADDTLLMFSSDEWLVSCNPRTAAITQYHVQVPTGNFRTIAYDTTSKTVYSSANFLSQNTLYSIHAQTLDISKTSITGIQGFIDSMAFDPAAQVLYGTSGYYTTVSSQLYRTDPVTGVTTSIATFPGTGVTDLTFDSSTGILYGTSTPGGYVSLTPPAVVKIDPRTGTLTTIYQGQFTGQFRGLTVVPGTLSFYSQYGGSFALLDAGSGQFTQFAGHWVGASGAVYQNFEVAPETPVNGPVSYSVTDLCYPASCVALVLNDKGVIAGRKSSISNLLFTASGAAGMSFIQSDFNVAYPHSMNNSGDFVGETQELDAFLYSHRTGQFYELNSVLGWNFGSANYINNRGDITGDGYPTGQTVFGYRLDTVKGITDSGYLIGASGGLGFVLPPGGTPLTSPIPPMVFNNYGQTLGYSSPGNPAIPAGGIGFYSPSGGFRPLPGNTLGLVPRGLNDSGIALLSSTGGAGAIIFDTSGSIPEISKSLVPLHALTPPSTGWSNLEAVALNNAGQIAVQATNVSNGRVTALLLTPTTRPGAAAVTSTSTSAEPRSVGSCGPVTLNGMSFDCRKAIRIERR